MQRKSILPVIRNLGGCGSTLVGRLLAALPNIILLSECNPRSAYLFNGVMNPLNQLRGWFPELLPVVDGIDEFELGHPPYFGNLLKKLQDHLDKQGKQLVIRDYSYVDFVGYPFVCWNPQNSSLDIATCGLFETKDIILVRHPADQLASLRTHYCMRRLDAQHFINSYIYFINYYNARHFGYEDIVNNPSDEMRWMCEELGLNWDDKALENFSTIDKITGNLERLTDKSISKPSRKDTVLQAEGELKKCDNYTRLLEMIGYTS